MIVPIRYVSILGLILIPKAWYFHSSAPIWDKHAIYFHHSGMLLRCLQSLFFTTCQLNLPPTVLETADFCYSNAPAPPHAHTQGSRCLMMTVEREQNRSQGRL